MSEMQRINLVYRLSDRDHCWSEQVRFRIQLLLFRSEENIKSDRSFKGKLFIFMFHLFFLSRDFFQYKTIFYTGMEELYTALNRNQQQMAPGYLVKLSGAKLLGVKLFYP